MPFTFAVRAGTVLPEPGVHRRLSLDPTWHKSGYGSSGNKFRQDLSMIKGIGSVISYYYGLIDILFNDVLGGFAPATAAAPNGDTSGKCSSHLTSAEVRYRNSTRPLFDILLRIFDFKEARIVPGYKTPLSETLPGLPSCRCGATRGYSWKYLSGW